MLPGWKRMLPGWKRMLPGWKRMLPGWKRVGEDSAPNYGTGELVLIVSNRLVADPVALK
jgi:hypothetical protein